MGTTSYLAGFIAWITCCAVTIDTSCSTERLPKITPTACLRPKVAAIESSQECLSKYRRIRRCQPDPPASGIRARNCHRQDALAALFTEQDSTRRLECWLRGAICCDIARKTRGKHL